MTEIDSAKPVTYCLKGIAIAAVVINHYINDFLPGEFGGYASGIIAVFFVLSGYGIYFSFEKNASSRLTARQVLGFFANRAIRIYPLYWASLTLSAITLQTHYSLGVIMGNPFVKAPGIYWFISAIIQCYLVAPFLYALLKRAGIKRYLAMVSIATLSVYFLQITVLNNFPRTFAYRSFPFAHILLFASGLSMPQLVSQYRRALAAHATAVMSCLAFIALVYLTRNAFIAAHGSLGVLRPLFVFACSAFCVTALAANPPLPLNTFFAFLGRYSFSIYLFHIPYFAILHAAGVSTFGSARGVVITLAFLPLFLLACRLSEDCTNTLRRRVLQVVS